MDMCRYVSVSLGSCMVDIIAGILSYFGSCSDVAKYKFSSICELLGIGEYCYEWSCS